MNRLDRAEPVGLALGLLVRLALVFGAIPWTYAHWFAPFLVHAVQAGATDPWTSFLAAGGDPAAFPYGPLYLLVFVPLAALGDLVAGARGAELGLGLTVLALDALLFLTLRRLAGAERRSIVTLAYWLSPVVIYIGYWHGQLDVLPVLLLTLSLLWLRQGRFAASGFALGSAVAAKLSMAVGLPFVWIYVVSARRLRSVAVRLVVASLAGLAVLAPFALSPGFRAMVLGTPERNKVFALAIAYGEGMRFYILPLVLVALVFAAWRIRRFNFDILFNFVGLAFFVLFLLTPASPGWALWLVPFLVMHLTRATAGGWVLAGAFSVLFVAFHLTTSAGPTLAAGADLAEPLALPAGMDGERVRNLLLSVYLAAGGAIAFRMFHDGVLSDPYYRSTRRPLLLGIAGDSGSGKDTLAEALEALFGRASTARVSGDDYHVWDRQKPMWRALTHLHPKANNLRRFTEDLLALGSGRSIRAPHYDHHLGRMTKPRVVKASDVVVAVGLHVLHTPELTAAFDLKIFLAMDEGLRRRLKLRRDVAVRGHSPAAVEAAIAKRQPDSERHIRPQAAFADLILSLAPADPRDLARPDDDDRPIRMSLAVEAPTGDLGALVRVLVGVCGLEVVPAASDGSGILIAGEARAGDVAAAARALSPGMFDYLGLRPVWADGVTGIMQLVVLDQIGQRLVARRV